MSFFSELKRRGIFPVAVAYTVVAWLLVQVADVLLPAFNSPDWVLRALIILLAIGFPVALVLSWLFEMTSEGVKRSEDMPPEYSSSSPVNKYLILFIISVLTAAVILFALDRFAWHDPESSTLFSDAPDNRSIAVLPFANRSAQQEDLFFSEGIHDDLLTRLAKITSLRVTSRTSVMRYRDTEKSIPEIGVELGVSAILEGGVQRVGDQVRINVQLIDAVNDGHLWAETYDRKLTAANLFAIQSEIARAIASALKTALTPVEEQRLDQIPTRNLAAYEAYLRGRQLMGRRSEDSFRRALENFRQSADLDPDFAGAYAGECEVQLIWYTLGGDTARFRAAKTACQKALSIDRDMTEVRIALATLHRYDGNTEQAIEEISLVLEMAPDNVDALIELALNYQNQDRLLEAEATLTRSTEVAPGNWQTFDALGSLYRNKKSIPQSNQLAVKQALKVVELIPDSASAYNNLGTSYFDLGQYEAAKSAWDRALELEPTRTGYTNRGLAYYYDGRFEESAEMQLRAIALAPSDHRAWGRLADSWRFVPGREEAAGEAYLSAIALAEPMLEINEQDWLTRAMLATYYARSNREDEARSFITLALAQSGNHPEVLVNSALIWQKLGDPENARQAMAEAVEKNQGYELYVTQDPDLGSLDYRN